MPDFPPDELQALERLVERHAGLFEVRTTPLTLPGGRVLSLHRLALGSNRPDAPAVGLFGGVHGLERVGARVVLAFLDQVAERAHWDQGLHDVLRRVRLVAMPVVNPGGLLRGSRANPRGVDLMRNAPVQAREPVPWGVGGHRLSPCLPWYRGREGEPMEPEAAALCELVEGELLGRPLALALDCHSGFGMRDRLWFPFAHRRTPMPALGALHALAHTYERSHPHHPYQFEPQSAQYLAHGDLWDHLVLRAGQRPGGVFLPLTLEMGSWVWVRKNPRQLFSRAGLFNPLLAHRERRVLRRHLPLLDFLLRAAASGTSWLPQDEVGLEVHRRAALARWYGARE